jgi:hypothetical protein
MQKQAAVAAARVRALEAAVEVRTRWRGLACSLSLLVAMAMSGILTVHGWQNARAGGGMEGLATTMQAMGLHALAPVPGPAVAGDSISAVLAATSTVGQAANRHTACPADAGLTGTAAAVAAHRDAATTTLPSGACVWVCPH